MKFMGWESKVSYEMLSCFCLFSWMVPFSLMLLFSSYQLVVGFGFLSLLFTFLAVILSTILYKWKHKSVPVDESAEENVLTSEGNSSHERENIAPIPMIMNESMIEEQASDDVAIAYDSDQLLSTSEDSELDGSISDEDSLIEIALPSGHFVSQQQKEECKFYNCSLQQNRKGLLSDETLFDQQSLMELLAEFNDMYEEENLIEIDISMGSIKCSRLEIQA